MGRLALWQVALAITARLARVAARLLGHPSVEVGAPESPLPPDLEGRKFPPLRHRVHGLVRDLEQGRDLLNREYLVAHPGGSPGLGWGPFLVDAKVRQRTPQRNGDRGRRCRPPLGQDHCVNGGQDLDLDIRSAPLGNVASAARLCPTCAQTSGHKGEIEGT